MTKITEWKQERPIWCRHHDCVFRRRAMDAVCGGVLPEPIPHGDALNTYRVCFQEDDYQVNATDLDWFRWIFDALDGKASSWLSMRDTTATAKETLVVPVISRARAEAAVPPEDCSGHIFSKDEREDLVRYVLQGAEIQRDTIEVAMREVAS